MRRPRNERRPDMWLDRDVVRGKLFRFRDTGVEHPLIEIFESEMPKLAGYEFYEPYWVIAHRPTMFAIYDFHERLIYGPDGLASDYNVESLVQRAGYPSVSSYKTEHGTNSDFDIWVQMGLPARVFLPSLRRKPN